MDTSALPGMDLALQSLKQGQSVKATKGLETAESSAREFEAMFLSQMLGYMWQGIETEGPFGGGPGEEMFRTLMINEYGKQIAANGGFGIADAVKAQLLSLQEHTSSEG